jgi:DNA anti-recombination protein RmuC
MADHWDELPDFHLDFSNINIAEDLEDILESMDQEKIDELEEKLAEVHQNFKDRAKQREVVSDILDVVKELISAGAVLV